MVDSHDVTASSTPVTEPVTGKAVPYTSPLSIVRGGTTSSYQEAIDQRDRYEQVQRQSKSDAMYASTTQNPLQNRMYSHSMGGGEDASVVIEVIGHERRVEDWLICDVRVLPKDDGIELMLIIPCPVCVLRNGKLVSQSQMTLRQSNRGFSLDTDKAGSVWVNPNDNAQVYVQPGEVSTHEAFRCGVCNTQYQIDKNKLRTV